MEWWMVLVFFIGGLIVVLMSGFPIAFGFLLVDIIGILVFFGMGGLEQVTLQVSSSLATFTLTPIPMFLFMGELMFHSGVAYQTIDVLDKWLGRLPGRLSLMGAAAGTLFAALSGSTIANTAMLGAVLLPDMRRRGYHTSMAIGPIMGVGGLAMLIPPSALAVVMASIGRISVGRLLIAGVMLGTMIALYIMLRCVLNPGLAPTYEVERSTWPERMTAFVKHILPLGLIIFMVLGLMLLGFATPTEAAASGVVSTMFVVAIFKRFTWTTLRKSLLGTIEIMVMIFMIIAASNTFSAILAFSGGTEGLIGMVEKLDLSPILLLITMQIIIFILGMFMETISIMMICLPIFMPIAKMLGFDPVWFGVIMLINFEMGLITPPFGMLLFVMKGVAPSDVSMADICRAALPFIACEMLAIALIVAFPPLALWLPSVMH